MTIATTEETPSPASISRAAWLALKRKRIRGGVVHTTRASSIGHDCERFLFYERTANEKRQLHDERTQAIFDLGNTLEKYALRELEDAGFEVLESQRDMADRRLEISGHIDACIIPPGWRGASLPAEIKGLNPYTAESIETIDDIRNSRQWWVRKYYAQLQTYLILRERDMGLFVLLNKVSGQIEFIECPLDYVFAESLLKKAERVRDAVKLGVPPQRHQTADCAKCPFVQICQPDISFGPGVDVVESAELVAMLKRREELDSAATEWEALDKSIKKMLPHSPEVLVGDWAILGSEVHRKGFEVKPSSFWKFEIRKMSKEKP